MQTGRFLIDNYTSRKASVGFKNVGYDCGMTLVAGRLIAVRTPPQRAGIAVG
jgi:hypothetical protein